MSAFFAPEVTATDLFCGGGGSSSGLQMVPGVGVVMAANHWNLAVQTHQLNHPNAAHDCADISQVDPRRYPTTTIAWFSPDCTKQTKASGRKRDLTAWSDGKTRPTDPAERSRATMWDVVRFAEYHSYEAIIVENVVEVLDWPPIGGWMLALTALKYEIQVVSMNSAHATIGGKGAATSRDRLYFLLSKIGAVKPDIAKWTSPYGTCLRCNTTAQLVKHWKNGKVSGKYGPQYIWHCSRCSATVRPDIRAAMSAVDWDAPALAVFDPRRRPGLVSKTLGKIEMGLLKHAVDGIAMPFMVEVRGGGSTTRAITDPLSTITAGGNHHGLVIPPGWDPLTGRGSRAVDSVRVGDCSYRMLKAPELKRGSAFEESYVLLGTNDEQRTMVGNAVNPPAARVLGAAVVEALTGSVALSTEQYAQAA